MNREYFGNEKVVIASEIYFFLTYINLSVTFLNVTFTIYMFQLKHGKKQQMFKNFLACDL